MKPEERRFPVAIDLKGRLVHPGCFPPPARAIRGSTLREDEARAARCNVCRQPIATVRPV